MVNPVDVVQEAAREIGRPLPSAAELEADAIYDLLIAHAYGGCRPCWGQRNSLWNPDRMCDQGAGLVAAYAAAVCGVECETTRPGGAPVLSIVTPEEGA